VDAEAEANETHVKAGPPASEAEQRRISHKADQTRQALINVMAWAEKVWHDPHASDEDKRHATEEVANAWAKGNNASLSFVAADPLNSIVYTGLPCKTQPADPDHSEDFHFVRWYGQEHTFTHQQAAVVKLLWQAWENGTPDLGKEYLLETSESSTDRLRNIFKEKGGMHPAWDAMIVESRQGVFRLSPPQKRI
jgi:hypothetical protein